MDDIIVHPHSLKHGLTEEDVAYAWNNFASAAVLADGTLLLIHAKTPATKKFKRELGYGRR